MKEREKPSINIVIPVYNEEKELEDSVRTLHGFLYTNLDDFTWKITIADNASTDRTFEISKKLSRTLTSVACVHFPKKGRGRAVKTVWGEGVYDIVAYMDVDLSTDLKHFPPLVHSLLRGYDISIGSRNAHSSRVYGRNLLRSFTSKTYILIIKIFFFVHFSDAQCGFKAISKKTVKELLPIIIDNEWFFDSELLIVGEKSGYRIYEEPVTWIDNPGSTVRVLKTALGDLQGLWRLFTTRPWRKFS